MSRRPAQNFCCSAINFSLTDAQELLLSPSCYGFWEVELVQTLLSGSPLLTGDTDVGQWSHKAEWRQG